jgi:hypothetical protein
MGVLAIRKGDRVARRVWMIRFAGSMWGAFWLFRVMHQAQCGLRETHECVWACVTQMQSLYLSRARGCRSQVSCAHGRFNQV